MPIHEYRCECGNKKEVLLSFAEADNPQTCECGEVMKIKISLSSFTFKPTSRGTALDTLNTSDGGFPNGKYKTWAQQKTFEGIDPPKRTVGTGF